MSPMELNRIINIFSTVVAFVYLQTYEIIRQKNNLLLLAHQHFYNFAVMIFVDTHTHLYLDQFDDDRSEVVEHALDKGVKYFILPNIDEKSKEKMLQVSRQWPEHMLPMTGLHPTSVKEEFDKQLEQVFIDLDTNKFYGVGEIGIDLYWDTSMEEQQRRAFSLQCQKAVELDLPVSIHMRNSFDAVVEEIRKLNDDRLRGVFHCFTGTEKQALQAVEMGFHLGIGGVLTFKNSGLHNEIRNIPLEHIVLETDSPYLTAHPYRGQRNESAYIPLIARRLAEIKMTDIETVAEKTTENARKIFRF